MCCLLLLILCFAIPAFGHNDANDVVKHLRPDFEKHTLLVRGFYQDLHLDYEASGKLLGPARTGSWTTAWMYISKLDLKNDRLELQGERAIEVFNDQQRRFDLPRTIYSMRVTVEVASAPDEAEIRKSLATVFISPNEPLPPMLPDYWHWLFMHLDAAGEFPLDQRVETPPSCGPDASPDQPCRVTPDVTPPKMIQSPQPGYNQLALDLHVHGKTVVSIVVDGSGHVQYPQITKPLGCGLDESAVDTLRTWLFQPATQNGKPVPVRINVDFNYQGSAKR